MPQKGIVENSLPSDLEIRYKRFSNCTQNTPSTHTNPPILAEAQPILAKIERFACSQSPQRPQAFAPAAQTFESRPSPGATPQFFTRFRPTMSKPLRMTSASLSFYGLARRTLERRTAKTAPLTAG